MYAIFKAPTGEIIGQSLAKTCEPGLSAFPLDRETYIRLMDNPALYRYHRIELVDGALTLREIRKVSWSQVPMIRLPDAEGHEDVIVIVDGEGLSLKTTTPLFEPFEVFALRHGMVELIVFHELMTEAPVKMKIKNPKELYVFSTRIAREYKYGVTLC